MTEASSTHDVAARNRRMLIIGGVIVLLGIIVAGGYWYTRSPSATTAKPASLQVTIDGSALVVGPANAPHTVVIDQTTAADGVRTFELASRGFLHADARAGIVQVRYLQAEAPTGDPTAALAAHDAAFDHATVVLEMAWVPSVMLDGHALTAATPLALADELEAALAR